MLKLYSICLLYALNIIILTAFSLDLENSEHNYWDTLVFTQQWPIASCIEHLNEKKGASCNIYTNMTSWTVHGMWPTLSGTRGPNFCNATWKFDMQKLSPIEPLLYKYWSNIFGDTSFSSLWKHEWLKHGTCAAEIKFLNGELKYFNQGVNWAIQYNMIDMLKRWKIFPDDENSYHLDDIFGVVKFVTGYNAVIDCSYNKKKKQHELWQIKLCFDRDLRLIDCSEGSSANKILGNCPSKGIIYPSSVNSFPWVDKGEATPRRVKPPTQCLIPDLLAARVMNGTYEV